jgi:hypothetical protein
MNTEIRTAYDRRQTLKILLSACGLAQRALGMDADYVAKYGEPPLTSYGRELQCWQPSRVPL